ncbi:hypothetical protein R1flu_011469 [Riccia fluitans]|uniref:Uncharacterized protein n=1 Tax=Riccia fluitans TaxID=41844 RepID=A0ABD1ZB56_9MARC
MRAANPTWNGKSTQVRKSFLFFTGLELHGIKLDWSIVNVHKGINRYSAEEKEKARKELWRMQVKFEGELCEPINLDSRKRRRTLGSRTSNKRSRESENTELGKRAEHIEAAASGPDGPDQVPVDQGRTHMSSGDAPADPSPVVDKGEAKVEEGLNTSDEKYLKKLDVAQMKRAKREKIEANRPTNRILAGTKPGLSSRKGSNRGHGQGGMDSPCPSRPTTQVEEDADHVHGFVDRMLHDFKIATQERDGLQKRLEEAEKSLKDMEALHAKIGMLEKEKEEMAERVRFMERPDLYELLTEKLRGHQIRGHPYVTQGTLHIDSGLVQALHTGTRLIVPSYH